MNNPYDSPQTPAGQENDRLLISSDDVQTTANKVAHFFEGEGYRLESGMPTDGFYGVGNNILRILFGAFVKRYRFHVTVLEYASGSSVTLEKGMSGVSGGAIGYSKMKKELERIKAGVRAVI